MPYNLSISAWALAISISCSVLPAALAQSQSYKNYDTSKPSYIEGRVVSVRWIEPVIQIDIMVTPGFAVPRDLATIDAPKNPEGNSIGTLAVEPADIGRRQDVWVLSIASSRAQAVGLKRESISLGRKLAAIGYGGCQLAQREFRPDYLILDGKAHLFRTTSLPKSQCPK